MRKLLVAFFLLFLIASPFIFLSCEKDNGTVDYDNVDDDDWKKREAAIMTDTIDISSVEYESTDNQ